MMWTKTTPTKEGYYWVKDTGVFSGRVYFHPVHVYNKGETVFSDGENFSSDNDMFQLWWDEPLSMPAIPYEPE